MNLVLFDDILKREALKPITLTIPVAEIRCGILTIKEKWEKHLNLSSSILTEEYLAGKFPAGYSEDNLYINASCLPIKTLVQELSNLSLEEALVYKGEIIGLRTSQKLSYGFKLPSGIKVKELSNSLIILSELPQLFLQNGGQIVEDFRLLTQNLRSQEITDKFTAVYGRENIFVGKNANIKAAVINAESGPVYIGDNAIVQEGAVIIGPVAIGNNAMVGYGAKIRANTTLGPFCRVGGEVSNAVFHSYSNKAHDGFLGNSYLGAWCNLGANTNNSNLKNNYKPVGLYSYFKRDFYDTGEIFCGTFMGDYTKAGISTMFNTGTSVGACCNIYGAGFQEKFIPSFSWGGNSRYEVYKFEKAIEVINATMGRRELVLDTEDVKILKYISENP